MAPKASSRRRTAVPRSSKREYVSFEWTLDLSYGDATAILNGKVIAPTGNPRAGVELCITQGAVGFPKGGPEDGIFTFWLRAARLGPNCSGAEVHRPPRLHELARGTMNGP